MDKRYVFICSVVFLLVSLSAKGQTFGFLFESAILRSQIDGDNLRGYQYPGYFLGIGSNISLSNAHNINIKTTYNKQGSLSKNAFHSKIGTDIRLECDIKAIGVEFSYKYAPPDQDFYWGAGFVHYQITDFEYHIIEIGNFQQREKLHDSEISKSFNCFKILMGYKITKAVHAYLFSENATNGLLVNDFYNIKALVPYSYGVAVVLELKTDKKKQKRRR